jgi:hypothetical protein
MLSPGAGLSPAVALGLAMLRLLPREWVKVSPRFERLAPILEILEILEHSI